MQAVNKKGFTIIELLVVIGIITILAGLLLPAVQGVRQKGYESRAKTEIKSIESAIKLYVNEYSKLPIDDDDQGREDVTTDDDYSEEVIKRLTGDNPGKILFLDNSDEDGVFLDPWKNQYKMIFDANYDNEIRHDGRDRKLQVIVYSEGARGSTNAFYSYDL